VKAQPTLGGSPRLSSRATFRSWLPAQRLRADVLRLRDGSTRGVLECGAPRTPLSQVVPVVARARHRVQVVVRSRSAVDAAATPLARLNVSYEHLLAELSGRPAPLVDRLLVVVPWDIEEGAGRDAALHARLRQIAQDLDRLGVEPIRVNGAALDALVSLEDVEERCREVRVGDRLARTLVLDSHPERLDRAWFGSLENEHDLAVHVAPVAPGRVAVSTYLTIWAADRSQLDRGSACVDQILFTHGVRSSRLDLQAEPALVSSLPMGLDLASAPDRHRLSSTRDTGMVVSSGRGSSGELLYGIDPGSRRPLLLDRFALDNPNAVVLGQPGSGASSLMRTELLRARLAGIESHVVDADGGHASLAPALGGTAIVLGIDGPSPFDPFTVTAGEGVLGDRIMTLAALVEVMAHGLPAPARLVGQDAIAFVYASHGYVGDVSDEDRVPPDLADVMVAVERRCSAASGTLRTSLETVRQRLDRYLTGEGRSLLTKPALRPGGGSPITVQSLAGVPVEDRAAAMLLAVDRAWHRLPDGRPALMTIDSVDPLLPYDGAARLLAGWANDANRRRAGLTLVVHDVPGALGSPLRDAVLGAGLKVLLRQSDAAVTSLGDALHLTPAERSWLLGASAGEGLLIADGRRQAFQSIASDEERRLTTEGGAR
jgi:hypothetical protein